MNQIKKHTAAGSKNGHRRDMGKTFILESDFKVKLE